MSNTVPNKAISRTTQTHAIFEKHSYVFTPNDTGAKFISVEPDDITNSTIFRGLCDGLCLDILRGSRALTLTSYLRIHNVRIRISQ